MLDKYIASTRAGYNFADQHVMEMVICSRYDLVSVVRGPANGDWLFVCPTSAPLRVHSTD